MTDVSGPLPHAVEAERTTLSVVLSDPAATAIAVDKLEVEDFYLPSHQAIFGAVKKLFGDAKPISRTAVGEELRRNGKLEEVGGFSYLNELVDFEPSAVGFESAVDTVKEKAIQRKLIQHAQQVVSEGLAGRQELDSLLEFAEKRLYTVVQERYKPSYHKLADVVRRVFHDVKERVKTGESSFGIRTGFKLLDELTGGLHKANLIVLASRPSMGKTALALSIAANCALRDDKAVAIFSLEMSAEELATRFLASEARVDAKNLRDGRILSSDLGRLVGALNNLANARVVLDDTPSLTMFELRARARRLKAENLCDLLIVDYLQLLRAPGTQSREQEIAEVSRKLKAIAKELDIPVLALAQLNRMLEQRKDKRPVLSDLRESGAIEQDADVIMFIYRDEYYNPDTQDRGIAEIIVGKQRNGPTGKLKLAFINKCTRFENLAYEQQDD